ncbi:hypothetical protein EVAR_46694_1 [Eumeta japonica]|uniref:Uncharacterized protein n=1 Tax=Eumeta variegata TaxID=151549 RepID=A0A4C1Y6K5_EUMVA|nr:hypothetical protein EVAR_46694_1 [Eumeta japonica]
MRMENDGERFFLHLSPKIVILPKVVEDLILQVSTTTRWNLAEWAGRVCGLVQRCGFKNELDIALRDRFVLGLENAKEKGKLFVESVEGLTLARALDLAQSVRVVRLVV